MRGRDLCGQYIGETAPRTSAICRDAYGSVLFIDEAYSLFRDEFSSARDYGREALDTLVAEMENHRDDFCVIMAGYKDEMDAMLKGNTGLMSRIPYEIEFPNYTRDDLEKIFFTMLDGTFDYEEGLKESVHGFFSEMPEEMFTSKEFSNARLVRNLFERTWGKAAYRQSLPQAGARGGAAFGGLRVPVHAVRAHGRFAGHGDGLWGRRPSGGHRKDHHAAPGPVGRGRLAARRAPAEHPRRRAPLGGPREL